MDEEKDKVCRDGWRIAMCIFEAYMFLLRNRKLDFFSARPNFISLMNTKSDSVTHAKPLEKILLLVFIRWNKIRSYTEN